MEIIISFLHAFFNGLLLDKNIEVYTALAIYFRGKKCSSGWRVPSPSTSLDSAPCAGDLTQVSLHLHGYWWLHALLSCNGIRTFPHFLH